MLAITGGSGFVGGALLQAVGAGRALVIGRAAPPGYLSVVADLAVPKALHDQLPDTAIDCMVHLAGVTPWSVQPDYALDMCMAETVVAACNERHIPRLVYVSGWNVYDPAAPVPYTETTPLRPDTPYGHSKVAVEAYLREHMQGELVVVRAASVYGPGQLSAGLIPNLTTLALAHEPLFLQARHTKRDYMYIADFVEVLQQLATATLPVRQLMLNVGSGQSVSVETIAHSIQSACRDMYGINVPVKYAESLQESPLSDNQLAIKAARKLGLLKVITSTREGIRAYVTWRHDETLL